MIGFRCTRDAEEVSFDASGVSSAGFREEKKIRGISIVRTTTLNDIDQWNTNVLGTVY